MNKAILIGRLTRDQEIRYTQSGTAVATFSLAVDRPYAHKEKAEQNQQTADFIPIIAWRKLAEIVGNNLTKGRRIMVEGRIQVRSYNAQDGSKRYMTEVIADNIEFLDSKKGSNPGGHITEGFGQTTGSVSGGNSAPEQMQFGPAVKDEEIPF